MSVIQVARFAKPPQRYVNGHAAAAGGRQPWLCVDCMAGIRSVDKCPAEKRKACEIREVGDRVFTYYRLINERR